MHYTTIILWLFTLNLGIAFGAGLYEARIVVPIWASKLPTGFAEIDTGRRFWGFVTTVPLTVLCVASLFAAHQSTGAVHSFWLASALVVVVERFLTFGYFIPTILRLQKGAFGSNSQRRFTQWRRINFIRN